MNLISMSILSIFIKTRQTQDDRRATREITQRMGSTELHWSNKNGVYKKSWLFKPKYLNFLIWKINLKYPKKHHHPFFKFMKTRLADWQRADKKKHKIHRSNLIQHTKTELSLRLFSHRWKSEHIAWKEHKTLPTWISSWAQKHWH